MSILVNLFGGPGSGKSTSMAGIFHDLKLNGVNCEMAPEYAKEKVWEKAFAILENQIYVFGKQLHTIVRLDKQVDVIITDSPLLLSLIYAKDEPVEFEKLVLAIFKRYNTMNYFIHRELGNYNPKGRMQTEDQSIEIDNKVHSMLRSNNIDFKYVQRGSDKEIVKDIMEKLNENN